MHRFFSPPENFAPNVVVLSEAETRHLRDVLRLSVGEIVRVFDGSGSEYECSVETIGKHETRLKLLNETTPTAPESSLDLTVAAAITPGEKFDLAIQKSVELGVTRFIPITTARCEIKLKDAERRIERWRRIAFEAAKQCGRAKLMSVENVATFSSVFDETRNPIVIFSERDGSSFDAIRADGKLTAVYGPKGGWTDEELMLARNSGANVITFGGRILRAETAAIAITAILQHRFGDMN
jgi:16S rRNA (uracil1498-N3)-methyltransferase